jgi:hypothetical protein
MSALCRYCISSLGHFLGNGAALGKVGTHTPLRHSLFGLEIVRDLGNSALNYDLGKSIRCPTFSLRSIFAHPFPSLHIPLCVPRPQSLKPPATCVSSLPSLFSVSSSELVHPPIARVSQHPIASMCVIPPSTSARTSTSSSSLLGMLILVSPFFYHHRHSNTCSCLPKTDQQTHVSVCRPFPSSSRRTSTPLRPLTLPDQLL